MTEDTELRTAVLNYLIALDAPEPPHPLDDYYETGPTTDEALARLRAALAEAPDFLDGARLEYQECMEVRRLLGYLWNATGKNHLRPVHDLFADDDPIVADVERLAIFADVSRDETP